MLKSPPTPMPTRSEVNARTALWLLLGAWFGAFLLFGAVIAPTAFAVLPTTEMAGSLVSPVVAKLHLFGAVAAILLSLLSRFLGRSTWLTAAPLLISGLCLYSHFGVSTELAEIRDLAFAAGGNPIITARFSMLHRISVGVFVSVGAAITILIGLHAWVDVRLLSGGEK